MKRIDVIEGLLACHAAPRYLEIGLGPEAETFGQVKAARKVGVDPQFLFAAPEPRVTEAIALHEVTSDDFFGTVVDPAERFDIIFIDGLHRSDQALRDLMNAIEHLAPGGAIVIDDILPNSYAAARPSMVEAVALRRHLPRETDDPAWMGDVYRVAFFVSTFLQAFSFACVLETPGQMVLWRQRRPGVATSDRSIEWVGRAGFADLYAHLDELQGRPYGDIVAAYRSGRT